MQQTDLTGDKTLQIDDWSNRKYIFTRSCEELTASVTKIASYVCTIGITLHILIHCNSMEGFTKIIMFLKEFQNWQINLYTYLSSRGSCNDFFLGILHNFNSRSSLTQFVLAVHTIRSRCLLYSFSPFTCIIIFVHTTVMYVCSTFI